MRDTVTAVLYGGPLDGGSVEVPFVPIHVSGLQAYRPVDPNLSPDDVLGVPIFLRLRRKEDAAGVEHCYHLPQAVEAITLLAYVFDETVKTPLPDTK